VAVKKPIKKAARKSAPPRVPESVPRVKRPARHGAKALKASVEAQGAAAARGGLDGTLGRGRQDRTLRTDPHTWAVEARASRPGPQQHPRSPAFAGPAAPRLHACLPASLRRAHSDLPGLPPC
jgi:hypothetical protein